LSRYGALGVDVKKRGVEAFRGVVDNLFPRAFCVVQQDPGDPGVGLVSHTDSAGSKPVQSYLHWRETGDASWFRGLAQHGLRVLFSGGETADLPDQMRTLDVSGSIFGRVDLDRVVTGEKIAPGDLIIGLRSGGRTSYEGGLNSGIMCNGLTLARSCLMKADYLERYPELSHSRRGRFTGRFGFDDYVDDLGMTVGEGLLSPTRVFAPVAAAVLERVGAAVHGMVHNTGGGQTKCLSLGGGVRYVKDSLPEPDPIFRLIQREAEVGWREMYEDFNMGVGFEFIVEPEAAEEVVGVAEGFGIGVQVIGRCERSLGENRLVIESSHGKFSYP